MIIVGRYVELNLPVVGQKFPVFYRPLDLIELNQFKQTAEHCGFTFKTQIHEIGTARHHVVILQK
jgi:hypothetical protein